jgi:NAD+ diphosphatase
MCRNGKQRKFRSTPGRFGMMTFGGNPLDRAGDRRTDPAWLAAQRTVGLFLPLWQNKPLVIDGRAGFLPWRTDWQDGTCVFLGLDENQPLFAIDIAGESEPALEGGRFQDMRASAFVLPAADTAMAGQAKALIDWHRRHGFCPNCGSPTQICDGGYRRLCPDCAAEHFPRTDPVVIMLPVLDNACLVGRNARFAGGLYSAFAGFVEPGETMEDAVRRELREEVNLAVGAIRYHASQPWPFPSSLMLGCYAEALERDFRIDGNEIADARWLTKDEVRNRLADTVQDDLKLPVTIAIAHHLIRDWAKD